MNHLTEDCSKTKKLEESELSDELIESELTDKGVVFLNGEITEKSAFDLCKKLEYLKQKKLREITIILNSGGGDVYPGIAIIDTINSLKEQNIEVKIETRGLCASLAMFILITGSQRLSSQFTGFLIHEIYGGLEGTISELKSDQIEYVRLENMLNEYLYSNTKITKEILKKKTLGKSWWLSAKEALEFKIIDKIV